MEASSLSVIIPAYNSVRYLAEAIGSVLGQTLLPDEIIVVDDGSTDGTARVIADVAHSASLAIIYQHQPNQGPSVARNRGLEIAQGDIVAFLDADDLWLPGKLHQQLAYLKAHEEAGGVVCHTEIFLEPGTAWPRGHNRAHYDRQPVAMLPSALMVHRRVFDIVGGFDPAYFTGEDSDWFFRARDAGIVIGIAPGVYLKRRLHQANLSLSPSASSHQLLRLIRASTARQQGKKE